MAGPLARFETRIFPETVRPIRTDSEMGEAAQVLTERAAVYFLPMESDQERADPSVAAQRWGKCLTRILNLTDRRNAAWRYLGPADAVTVSHADDLGMHSTPFPPDSSNDVIHFHRTVGIVRATFAQSTLAYRDTPDHELPAINERLTTLLRKGRTDTRYAQPDTFQQLEVGDQQALVFRLAVRNAKLPLLHDFETIGKSRQHIIDQIASVQALMDVLGYH